MQIIKHGSLFSGIGGFDLAAEWMGWKNNFHCEWNDFGKRILNYYWPNAISYDDITKTDFTIHRGTIDVLTGGFPCQPYSVAGKRKGKEDERHLWPEMLRAIREIQPTYIVGENVSGLITWNNGLVFHEVQTDLENEGYEVQPFVLPACAVNAPHRRDRVWFIAYSNSRRNDRAKRTEACIWKQSHTEQQRNRGAMQIDGFSNEQLAPYPSNTRSKNLQPGENRIYELGITSNTGLFGQEKHEKQTAGVEQYSERDVMYPNSTSEQGQYFGQKGEGKFNRPDSRNGINNWENFPTEPPICGGNDGLPSELDGVTFPKWRNESIKAFGNAIVPQVAYQIFKAIQLHKNH